MRFILPIHDHFDVTPVAQSLEAEGVSVKTRRLAPTERLELAENDIVLLAFALLGATPVSVFAEALQSLCAASQHQCDAPAVERCCCVGSVGGSVPATTEKGPELRSAPVMLAPAALTACGLGFVFPIDAWFHVCSRAARPPLPLHLLNVSILL